MRIFKVSKKLVKVKVFSAETCQKLDKSIHNLGEFQIQFEYGDFSELIELLIFHLHEAQKFGSQIQKEILGHYIEYYKSGEFIHFEKSQIKWVQDENPKVDTNFGF